MIASFLALAWFQKRRAARAEGTGAVTGEAGSQEDGRSSVGESESIELRGYDGVAELDGGGVGGRI